MLFYGPGGILAVAAAQSGGAAAGPTELLVNGGAGSGANWTAGHIGGVTDPTIAGGKFLFTAGTAGNQQFFLQTLAGGSVPAADYAVGIDMDSSDDDLTLFLVGAGAENRGSTIFGAGTGPGQTAVITATGEVSSVRMSTAGDVIADNVTMIGPN